MDKETRGLLFLLFIILCGTLLPFIGIVDFHTKGEPREAMVALSMLETGNWILPTNFGVDIAYKPPFFHWMIALASLPFGEVTEFSSRLPSTVALIVMSLFFFIFFAKRVDTMRSFIATLIMVTTFEVHRAAMNTRVDMVLTAMIVLAILELYKWYEHGMKGIPFWSIIFMSCGTLTKGPVGFLLPCGSMGLFLLLNGRNFFYALFKMAYPAILACVLPTVWYYLAYLQGGDEFLRLVVEENFGRFFGKMSYESHENPAIYNVLTLITGYIPWTILLILSLFTLHYKRSWKYLGNGINTKAVKFWRAVKEWFEEIDRPRLYAATTTVLIFVFYCIPKSKRSVYLLPIYPFIAVYVADFLVWIVMDRTKIYKIFNGIIFCATMILLIVWGTLKTGVIEPERYLSGRTAVKLARYTQVIEDAPFTIIGLVGLGMCILCFALFFRNAMQRKRVFISSSFALIFGLQFLLDGMLQPMILNDKSMKNFSYSIGQTIGNAPLYQYISVDMLRFYITNFYLDDRVRLFEEEYPDSGFLIVGERDFEKFNNKYGDSYIFEEIMRSPHSDTEVRDFIKLYSFSKDPNAVYDDNDDDDDIESTDSNNNASDNVPFYELQ